MAYFHMLFLAVTVIFVGCTKTATANYSEDVEKMFSDLIDERNDFSACIATAKNKMETFSDIGSDKKYAAGIINLYTQHCPSENKFYEELNKKLRVGRAYGVWKSARDLIDEGIDLLTTAVYPEVFRGCQQFDAIPKEGESCFRFNQITSTSLNLSIAVGFAMNVESTCGFLFQITNVKGLAAKKYSAFPSENEIILQSSHAFKVTRVINDRSEIEKAFEETLETVPHTLIVLDGGKLGRVRRSDSISCKRGDNTGEGCQSVSNRYYILLIVCFNIILL